MRLTRTRNFIVVEADAPVSLVLRTFEESTAPYLIVRRREGDRLYWYVFPRPVFTAFFFEILSQAVTAGDRRPFRDVVPGLHEYESAPTFPASRRTLAWSADFTQGSWPDARLPVAVKGDEAVGLWTMSAAPATKRKKNGGRRELATLGPSEIRILPPAERETANGETRASGIYVPGAERGESEAPFSAAPEARRKGTAFPEIEPSTEHPVVGYPFTITVRLTDTPSPFVRSGGVDLGETEPARIHTLSVHLLFGGRSAWDTVEYGVALGTRKPAVFQVTAPAPAASPDGEIPRSRMETIAVNFYLGHRWSGEGYRNVEVRSDAGVPAAKTIPVPDDPAWRRTLAVAPYAEPPDLLVRIQRDPARPDTYVWSCLSPWADLRPAAEGDDRMAMPERADQFVKKMFEPVATTQLNRLTSRRVDGIGEEIYRSTPKVFKDAYWRLHDLARADERVTFETIQIVTDEPYVPWELMRVANPGGPPGEGAEFLSIRHSVGRWIADASCHLDQTIAVERLAVLASDYVGTDTEPKLPWVNEERRYLSEKFGAKPYPLRANDVLDFLEKPGQPAPDAAHFACHGRMYVDTPSESCLVLEDDSRGFTPQVVSRQEVRQGFGSMHPFVFLNACQVGGAGRTLTLVAGFPAAFLQAGASAVVCPLWTVMDERAQKVTTEFYDLVFGPAPIPLGAALKQIRAKWRTEGQLTYLAYVLYGDPKATVTFRPAP
jgi:hypothetical protein